MGIILGLGSVIAIVALLLKEQAKRPLSDKPFAKGLPDNVKKTIIRADGATKTELQIAASSATMAGYSMLGEALLRRSENAPEKIAQQSNQSPIPNVSNDIWNRFAQTIQNSAASPNGIGAYHITIRRLGDFGLLKNPRKSGPNGVWTADWLVPREKFLADTALQRKIFSQSMRQYVNLIEAKYAPAIGKIFEGRKATLSGLLAVAHIAGEAGLSKWLANDPPRSKFRTTNGAFANANEIF